MTEWKFNDLLLKIKQGNKAAFDTLYKEYYPKMLFTANNITNNTVAVQFFLFNMKIKEIAKYLNEPVGTVKWRISEIKKYFEKVLK